MSLKKLISISLIVYGSMTSLLVVYGLFIAPPLKTDRLFPENATQPGVGAASTINDSNSPTANPDGNSTPPTSTPSTGRSSPAQPPAESASAPAAAGPSTPVNSSRPTASSPPTASPSAPPSVPSPTPAPPPPAPPAPGCGSAGGSCTAAQVATHNSASNCWVIYNGGYYIVTSYVSKHNGGSSVFNANTCGHDISGYMNGTRSTAGKTQRHSASAYSTLSSYYVGKVSG